MDFQKTNPSAYLNFLRSTYERLNGEVDAKSLPYILLIDPTSICQLRCPLCPTGVENESRRSGQRLQYRNRTLMSTEMFDSVLNELGDYLFFIMFYNWGEPLLNKELPGFIRKAKAYNISTEIHTNLSLRLTDEYIEDLLCSGIDNIAASIDGFSTESYQTYRRGGNFELAKNNLARLALARDKLGLKTNLIWNFLVFSFNENEIEATRRYCETIGIVFNRREAFINDPDWLPSYRKAEANPPAVAEAVTSPEQESDPAPALRSNSRAACAWHYNYSIVNADGSVSPCCVPWEQEHDFGLIRPEEISFADVWNNDLYRKSRAAFANKKVEGLDGVNTICVKCPYGKGIQHIYSNYDVDVINQYHRSIKGNYHNIDEAFKLLDNPKKLVEFFEKNFIDDLSVQKQEDALDTIKLSLNSLWKRLPSVLRQK